MNFPVTAGQIALRLACTLVAGMLVGLNRDENGRPAGMRTTVLVALAASLAMIEANLLLGTAGKTGSSFSVLDLMRLPLGILDGMGFIGAGVIIQRGGEVSGVTTAATLWFVTVVGLCFGGGQLVLGVVAVAIALLVLWAMKPLERRVRQQRTARLSLTLGDDGPDAERIRAEIRALGMKPGPLSCSYDGEGKLRRIECDVTWRTPHRSPKTPPEVAMLVKQPGVTSLDWKA